MVDWQSRPLDGVYPILYLDCIVVKIRQDKQVINKAIYVGLGVNMEGRKELLGLWLSENEGAKFWLGVLTELQNRGVKDILIASATAPALPYLLHPCSRAWMALKAFLRPSMPSSLKPWYNSVLSIWCAIQ